MTVYVFPGQGAQSKGMGGTLFDDYREYTQKADAILGYSIKDLCLNDPHNQLADTRYTQVAMYVVNALVYLIKSKQRGSKPDYVAGHSLGEYDALFASGAFDFETGLKLVQKRAELMSQATGGGMAAVIGLDEEKVKKVLEENNLTEVTAANFNAPVQIVLSGKKEAIENAKPLFEKAGARLYIPLNVSGAFHSKYMEDASREFGQFMESFQFGKLEIPVISNVTARPYAQEDIKKNLILQITHPVKWTETIRYLMGKGEAEFEEIGHGTVLTGLIKQIQKDGKPLVVEDEKTAKEQKHEPAKKEPKEEKHKKESTSHAKHAEPEKASKPKTAPQSASKSGGDMKAIKPEVLGSEAFRKDYNLKYAYVTGAMYRGIASKELIVRIGKAGLMGFLGTGSLGLKDIEASIQYIQKELPDGQNYGMNLLCNLISPQMEEETVDLYLKYGIRNVEAAAYMQLTPALVRYRLAGLRKGEDGKVIADNKIIGKISRPEVAEHFLRPAPERIVSKLVEAGKVTKEAAELAKHIPMADDLCAEADSGGHTDMGVMTALLPAIQKQRDLVVAEYDYPKAVRVGAAGGIGTPEAAAAAFALGADFIVTGSINQCTPEAGTSAPVKDLLQQCNIQDTDYAPAGDMFEIGAKVQVLKKGLFFPARANKLYELYKFYNSIDEIDEKTKKQIQEKYFKKSFNDIWEETKAYFKDRQPEELAKAEQSPKHKMALIFRWYFGYTTNLAMTGSDASRVDYQVHCGPALGAFNQWVKGTELEDWHNRHVDTIAEKLMQDTATLLTNFYGRLQA